jgi:hypothetical protein
VWVRALNLWANSEAWQCSDRGTLLAALAADDSLAVDQTVLRRAAGAAVVSHDRAVDHHPEDAVHHPPVVFALEAGTPFRQHRFNGAPLKIGKVVAHASSPQFGSLNHCSPI